MKLPGRKRAEGEGLPVNRRRPSAPPKSTSQRVKLLPAVGRWGRRVAELATLVAAIAGLVVLGRWTHTYVTTSPYFSAGVAEVEGNGRVTDEEIQLMSGLAPGVNIFSVSPAEASRRIVEHPWIATAEVRRRLPSHVMIDVVEREAVAILRLDTMYLLDAEGTAFKRVEPGDPLDLPVITGLDRGRDGEDGLAARADLNEALGLLRLYEESGLSGTAALSEVHLEADGSLSLITLEQGTHIRVGRPPFRRKLRRLARLYRELRSRRAVADYVYLEETDDHVQPARAVVRLRAN